MVKFLLLALAFGLAHAQAKIEGNWVTLAIAADNVGKVVLEGPLRIYVREITCNEECSEMEITFYVNLNGQCSKTKVTGYKQADGSYRTQYEGDNKFELTYLTATHAVFKSKNVDRAGTETNLIFILGKGQPLTEEAHRKVEAYVETHNIPSENLQDVLATDTCPM